MICWIIGNVTDPWEPLFLTRTHQVIFKNKKIPNRFKHILFWGIWESKKRTCWKRRVPENPWDPSFQISKILNMGAISLTKHGMESLEFQFTSRTISNWRIFLFSIKGIPPPQPIPIPTLAWAPPGGHECSGLSRKRQFENISTNMWPNLWSNLEQ